MEGFFGFLALIWSVLCIILFFKVWNMCNNVQRIREILEDKNKNQDNSTYHDKNRHQENNTYQDKNKRQDKKNRNESRSQDLPECGVKIINPW